MTQASDTILEVRDLRVEFNTDIGRTVAVDGVSYDVKRGRTLAIVGESGSGKSVSAYAMMRLIQKPGEITGGTITLHGDGKEPVEIVGLAKKDPRIHDLRGGRISIIFQEPMTALSPVHTVGDQITEAILNHQDVSKKEANRMAAEMMDKVGIPFPEQRLKQYPFEFSGGMRQRVVIAMALVCKPELLICDEPTTALDVTIQAQILQLINEMQEEMGMSVIFITHDLGVVAQVADDVVVMYKGRIMEIGDVRSVLKHPLHPYSKGLLAAIPTIDTDQERLPTIDSEVGDFDLTRAHPLRQVEGGRWVSLPQEEGTS